MQRIDEAYSLWTRAHAQLVRAERKWGEVVVRGSAEECRAVDGEVCMLRARSDALLRSASETLKQGLVEKCRERPRA